MLGIVQKHEIKIFLRKFQLDLQIFRELWSEI